MSVPVFCATAIMTNCALVKTQSSESERYIIPALGKAHHRAASDTGRRPVCGLRDVGVLFGGKPVHFSHDVSLFSLRVPLTAKHYE